jgi:ABC-type uncharacterized transport system permease subunit
VVEWTLLLINDTLLPLRRSILVTSVSTRFYGSTSINLSTTCTTIGTLEYGVLPLAIVHTTLQSKVRVFVVTANGVTSTVKLSSLKSYSKMVLKCTPYSGVLGEISILYVQ